MINRPRCRDWSPLATQQLRLRNLIQITGHNIKADENTSIYFTLHLTLMSAPFFTSERIDSFRNAIWAEINCQSINKSTSQFVVVRIWQTTRQLSNQNAFPNTQFRRRSSISERKCNESIDQKRNDNKDKTLFVWGVYFSGLVPITKRSAVKFKENALMFYIHGGFFTSADFMEPESIGLQYDCFFRLRGQSNNSLLTKESAINTKNSLNLINFSKNCDNSTSSNRQLIDNYNINDDSISNFIKTSKIAGTSPKGSEISGRLSPSSDVMAACSPIASPNIRPANDFGKFYDPNVLKVRYVEKEFQKWEIRRSYNVKKLLLLQEKQRIFRRESISANEIMEKICMKSASCLNLQLIANKGMIYRPKANPSIGRTLNRLLSTQPEQLKPEDLLKAQELRQKIETAKFRCRFLVMERDRYKVTLRKLHEKCAKLSDENIEKESWMLEDYRELSRNREMANEQRQLYLNKFKIYQNVKEMLVQRQYQLLRQLTDVYVIKERDRSGLMEINGICLPNTDSLRLFYSSNLPNSSNAASNLSVAMCYVAHIVLLCSTVLNIPLRNKIIYQGSASKIRDDIKVLSEHDREFPLFCRYIPPSDSLLYAAFLLNQNISQIKFMLNIHSSPEDIRATLPNLLSILTVGERTSQRSNAIQKSISSSFLSADAVDQPMTSVSETSIDMMITLPAKKTYTGSEQNMNSSDFHGQNGLQKTRRSYSNDHLTTCQRTCTANKRLNSDKIYGSEPTLTAEQLQ